MGFTEQRKLVRVLNETENEIVSHVTDFPIIILRSIWGFVNILNEKSVITHKVLFSLILFSWKCLCDLTFTLKTDMQWIFFCWYIELHTLSFSDIIFLFHRVTLWTEAIIAWKHLPGYWLWRPSKMFLSILTWNWANVYTVLWESKHEVEKSPSHQKQTNLSFIIFLLLHLMTSCLLFCM